METPDQHLPHVRTCRAPWANCSQIDLMKTHLQCRRFRPQTKIELSCIDKEGVCDDGAPVLARFLPLAERLVRKPNVRATPVIVKVVLRDVAPVRPIGPEKIALVEVDNIIFQRE